jgi:hypothetical protein
LDLAGHFFFDDFWLGLARANDQRERSQYGEQGCEPFRTLHNLPPSFLGGLGCQGNPLDNEKATR